MALIRVLRLRRRAADSASVPVTRSVMDLATCAKTGTFAPACSSGAMSFLRRKSPSARGLPAIASRRTSFADSSIKARLIGRMGLVSKPDDVAFGHDAQRFGAQFLRVEVMV